MAVKTDEKIRKVLKKDVVKTEGIDDFNFKTNKDKKFNEHFIDTEALVDIREIEKYETTFPFYSDSHSNTFISDTQQKISPAADPTRDNTVITELLGTEESVLRDNDSSCSEKFDNVEITPEIPKNKKIEKPKRPLKTKRGSTKSLCALKRAYKTRKSLQKDADAQLSIEIAGESAEGSCENVTKKIRYQCEQCNKYFWEKNKYEGHMKQVHEGIRRPYQCPECEKSYNLYKTLLQHKRECHGEKSVEIFNCEKCDKTFKTAVILKQHLTNKHSEQKEAMRTICDQCGFIAAHQYSLARHIINKHTETDQIKCEQCPKVFKTQYSLKYHIIGNHNPTNIKPFKCPECQMGFTRKTLLNQHKGTHLKYAERIKCDFEGCEVRFVKHGDKTHHMRLVHLKVKQHICDFCGEAFGAMQTLRHHRFIHTGEKPYKCNVCGQGFRQRTAMKTHRKTHFGKATEGQDLINNLPEINLSLINTLST